MKLNNIIYTLYIINRLKLINLFFNYILLICLIYVLHRFINDLWLYNII